MEDQNLHESAPIQPEPAVSFPDPRPSKQQSSFPKWIFAVIGLVVILAAGGFFLYQSSTSTTTNPTPSPFVSGIEVLPTPTETPIPTVAPSATPTSTPSSAQRSSVSIEIQNGTGTTGDAAVAKSLLEKAGYSKLTTANATSQTATSTTLQYSSDVPASLIAEMVQALSTSFGTPTATAGLSGKMSVRVITGPKSAATPAATKKASATPTPTASPKATTTAKPSLSPTASPTATP